MAQGALLSAIAVLVGLLGGLALLTGPVIIAVAIASKRRWMAAGVMVGLAALFGAGQYQSEQSAESAVREQLGALRLYVALTFALVCAPGLVMAAGLARGWTYTRTVTVVTLVVFGVTTSGIVLNWKGWNQQIDTFFEDQRTAIKDRADQFGDQFVTDSLSALTRLRDSKHAVGFGVGFVFGLITASVYTSVTGGVLRRLLGRPGFAGSFKDFRPTEWLVWGAIAVALGCLLEYHWPNPVLRAVAWNSAIALASVYWFNGLSIVVYGVHVLRPGLLAFAGFLLVVIALINLGMMPVLGLVGLFDTWGDYRRKLDALGAARRSGGPPPLPMA